MVWRNRASVASGIGALASLAIFSSGCGPALVRGQANQLGVGVVSEDDPYGVRPSLDLAEGNRVGLTGSPALPPFRASRGDIRSVESGDSSIVAAELTPNGWVLDGCAPGISRVWIGIAPASGNNLVRDVFSIRVSPVAALDVLALPCDGPCAAIVGRPLRVHVRAYDATGAELVLGGMFPVSAEPNDVATLTAAPGFTRSLDVTIEHPGHLSLHGGRGEPQDIEAISSGDIGALAVRAARLFFEWDPTHPEFDPRGLALSPIVVVGGKRLTLISNAVKVHSRTPDVCDAASDAVNAGLASVLGTGFVFIDGIREGNCQVDLEVEGATTSYSQYLAAPLPRFAGDVSPSLSNGLTVWRHLTTRAPSIPRDPATGLPD